MIEVKSIQPFLINIDGNQKVVYYEPEKKILLGYTFTKNQEIEIMKIIDPPCQIDSIVYNSHNILQETMNTKLEAETAFNKIKEIYVN